MTRFYDLARQWYRYSKLLLSIWHCSFCACMMFMQMHSSKVESLCWYYLKHNNYIKKRIWEVSDMVNWIRESWNACINLYSKIDVTVSYMSSNLTEASIAINSYLSVQVKHETKLNVLYVQTLGEMPKSNLLWRLNSSTSLLCLMCIHFTACNVFDSIQTRLAISKFCWDQGILVKLMFGCLLPIINLQ